MSMHESEAETLSVFLCAGNDLNLSALIMSERKMFGIFFITRMWGVTKG